MASTRRMGVENSETRAQLIDAAEEIIRVEGCAALTARRLAERVGLKRQIVHYYFGTIDDLFLAVMRRGAEHTRARLREALKTDEPLRVMWREGHFATTTSLELIAMAARHEPARLEIKSHIEEFRSFLTQALARELELRGVKPTIPPSVVTLVVTGVSESLAVEAALGVSDAHAETKAFFQNWLRTYVERGELLDLRSDKISRKRASTRRQVIRKRKVTPRRKQRLGG